MTQNHDLPPSAAEDGPTRRDRTMGCLIGLVLLVLTGIAAPVVALAGYGLAHERAGLDAYDSAPTCTSTTANPADPACRRIVEYTVQFGAERGGGHAAQWWLYLVSASGVEKQIQLVSPTGVWPAGDDETVYVTLWHGTPVQVYDGRYTSRTVNSVLQTGQGPYAWLWITSALDVYFVLLLAVRRRPLVLLSAPLAITLAGVAFYGRVVGGPWLHDPILILLVCVLLYGLAVASAAHRPDRRRPPGGGQTA